MPIGVDRFTNNPLNGLTKAELDTERTVYTSGSAEFQKFALTTNITALQTVAAQYGEKARADYEAALYQTELLAKH